MSLLSSFLAVVKGCCHWLQDNLIHGRFLAELTKEVLADLEASKYQHAEYRIRSSCLNLSSPDFLALCGCPLVAATPGAWPNPEPLILILNPRVRP
jgi:AMP deaminase